MATPLGTTATDPDAREREVYIGYPALVEFLAGYLRPLLDMPLKEMAAANERMQVLAPFFSVPVLYQTGAKNLEDQRKVIDAARNLQVVLESLRPAESGGAS